ncbi:MAG: TolC family protein, partial [Candidatus Angelobacter sp.]
MIHSRSVYAVFGLLLFVSLRGQSQQPAPASSQAPLTLTLQDALKLARSNSVPFQAALTDQGIARQDKAQARAALLPSLNYNNAYTFTEGTGITQATGANQPAAVAAPRFIANNAVHEYLSQAELQQVFG